MVPAKDCRLSHGCFPALMVAPPADVAGLEAGCDHLGIITRELGVLTAARRKGLDDDEQTVSSASRGSALHRVPDSCSVAHMLGPGLRNEVAGG
jgi:hypothetical protein